MAAKLIKNQNNPQQQTALSNQKTASHAQPTTQLASGWSPRAEVARVQQQRVNAPHNARMAFASLFAGQGTTRS
jgi:hypothetical protein